MNTVSSELKGKITRLWTLLENPDNREALDHGKVEHKIIGEFLNAITNVEAAFPPLDPSFERYCTLHDGQVHDPLGAGSYIFRRDYIPAIIRNLGLPLADNGRTASTASLRPTTLIVHIGAQPNNSPHGGTLVVFFKSFLVAKAIQDFYRDILHKKAVSTDFLRWIEDFRILVQLDFVDTAPDNAFSVNRNGIQYQRSQRSTQAFRAVEPDYEEVMALGASLVGGTIPYEIKTQADFTAMAGIPGIVENIVKDRERIGWELSPERGVLAIRAACPHEGCGLSDKHGIKNEYTIEPSGSVTISFECCDHGRHSISTSNPADITKLEFNAPLRNLIRALAFGIDTQDSQKAAGRQDARGQDDARERLHLRVTGSDYAGFYSEQLLWRQLMLMTPKIMPPVIVYAPLIVDWAGSKLSKSLYVREDAYKYLKESGRDYLLSFAKMKARNCDPEALFRTVEKWMETPEKMFRSYSVEYVDRIFLEHHART